VDEVRGELAIDVVGRYLAAVQYARQRRSDEAWRRAADLLGEDVLWRFAGAGADTMWRVEITGRDEVIAALAQPANSWDRLHTETVTMLACGSVVLVEQASTLVDDTGLELVKPVAHVFTVTDRHVTEIRTYRNDAR
jgi:ketosteroid isomerase-like protein